MADSSTTFPGSLSSPESSSPRVLLLGWEYAPRLTGGLGTASVRLAHALADKVELSVIVPRLPEEEEIVESEEELPLSELAAPGDGPDELRHFPPSAEWPEQTLAARPARSRPTSSRHPGSAATAVLTTGSTPEKVLATAPRLQVLSELTAEQVRTATAPRRPPRYEAFAKQVLHVALDVPSPYVDGPAEERETIAEAQAIPPASVAIPETSVLQSVVAVSEDFIAPEAAVLQEISAPAPEMLAEPETAEAAQLEAAETLSMVSQETEEAIIEEPVTEVLAEPLAGELPTPAEPLAPSDPDPVAEALAPFRKPSLNPLTLPSSNAEVVQFARLAARLASGDPLDVVYAHDWPTFLAGVEIRLEKRIPLVLHVHSTSYDRHGPQPNGWVFELERAAFRAADCIVAVSQYGAQILTEQYGVDARRIQVVHHGLAAGPLGPQWEARSVGKDPLVLFIGRLTAQKNPLGFVEIARRVVEEVPQARFAIAGDGPLREKVRQAAIDAGFDAAGFEFLGFLDDEAVQLKLAEAAVVCLPARSEPFGLAALEAAAAGVPLVLSATTGAAEVLPGALTADFDDAVSLAAHVTHLLRDEPARRRAVRENAAAARRLSWERAAEEVLTILQEVRR